MARHDGDAPRSASVGQLLVLAAIGLGAGLLSGLFGVGGGVIMVPAMVMLSGISQHTAHATSLAAVVPIAAVGALVFGRAESVDLPAAAALVVGSLLGVQLGARVMNRLSGEALTRIFGVFLLIVALTLFL
jgi:uncharacterized membrane protein YfcA